MRAEFWVTISAKKRGSVKQALWQMDAVNVRKNKPTTGPNEVAVKITIDIPDSYFETPELSAHIQVDENDINRPEITSDVKDNLAEAIQNQLGVRCHLDITGEQEPDQ